MARRGRAIPLKAENQFVVIASRLRGNDGLRAIRGRCAFQLAAPCFSKGGRESSRRLLFFRGTRRRGQVDAPQAPFPFPFDPCVEFVADMTAQHYV